MKLRNSSVYVSDRFVKQNIDHRTDKPLFDKLLVFPDELACEQAPGGASAEQTFGAKRRAIGACTHSPISPLPPTRRLSC